jgi:hypothetical protein
MVLHRRMRCLMIGLTGASRCTMVRRRVRPIGRQRMESLGSSGGGCRDEHMVSHIRNVQHNVHGSCSDAFTVHSPPDSREKAPVIKLSGCTQSPLSITHPHTLGRHSMANTAKPLLSRIAQILFRDVAGSRLKIFVQSTRTPIASTTARRCSEGRTTRRENPHQNPARRLRSIPQDASIGSRINIDCIRMDLGPTK